MKPLFVCVSAMLSLVFVLGVNQAGDKDKKPAPKFKIKEVMEKANSDGGLLEKVTEGTATAKDKTELVDLYVALHDNIPPKGDRAKWEKLTQKIVDAAKAVAANPDAKDTAPADRLAKLVNCKECHSEFRVFKKKAG